MHVMSRNLNPDLVYDRFGHLLEEVNDSTGAAIREYVWMGNMPVAIVDDTGASPVLYYIHTDQLGSSQKITDASLNIDWDGAFDPFGNIASLTGTLTNNLRFPGQYADAETALNQNWARDYDPTIGRYIQSDPIGLLGGINTYAYASGNPVSMFDPSGLDTTMTCRPIRTSWLAALGAVHCSVIVWHWTDCPVCNHRAIDGQFGMERGGIGFTRNTNSETYQSDRSAFCDPSGDDEAFSITPFFSGMSQDQLDNNILTYGSDYDQGPYNALFNNSNTAASTLILGSGAIPPDVPGAFGEREIL